MKLSESGIKLLTRLEKLALEPYDDQTGLKIIEWCKGATIGIGHLILKDEWERFKNGITIEQAEKLLSVDVEPVEDIINKSVEVELTQNKFDACVIFAFNIGNSGFANSSALKWINGQGNKTNFDSLESAWKAWNKSQGKYMRGLDNRRNSEWELYNS